MMALLASKPQPGQTLLHLIPSAIPTQWFSLTSTKTKVKCYVNRYKHILYRYVKGDILERLLFVLTLTLERSSG